MKKHLEQVAVPSVAVSGKSGYCKDQVGMLVNAVKTFEAK